MKKIILFFGGADKDNLTLKIMQAICTDKNIDFDIILGQPNPNKNEIIAFSKKHSNTNIYIGLPNLADKIANADLAVGAGGSTIWERLCLGIPSLVFSTAKNQIRSCQELANKGYILYLGDQELFESGNLLAAIQTCKNNYLRHFISEHGAALVDGLGCQKVNQYLLQNV